MKKLLLVGLLGISITASAKDSIGNTINALLGNSSNGNHYGNGNGNQNGNGNGGNGNHYGWSEPVGNEDNPGEVGGDPDDNTNVPIDDYVPVLLAVAVGYGVYMKKKRIA
jgi:hypothetical protein